MNYTEELHWILDKPGTTIHNQDEKTRENIAFVHSLGRKCDRVGWSTLRRNDPRAEEILEKITAFCNGNGWTARGLYTREYMDVDSDWYEIQSVYFKDNTIGEFSDVLIQDGSYIRIPIIKAYRELTTAPKGWGHGLYIPERFRNTYEKYGLTGLDFCWLKDAGKFTAEQYFEVYGTQLIPRVAVDWNLKKQDLHNLGQDGGWLPRLDEIFHSWTQINLPYCYKKEDMPIQGIAYAYIPRTFHCCGLYKVLVHKDTAKVLLQEKAIPVSALKPVPVVDEVPAGYTLQNTVSCPRPTQAYMEQSILDYEKLKAKSRPVWQISEKDALKVMRKAKNARKEDFGKKLSKAKAEALNDTVYEPMLPFYQVAEVGQLSDEYRLLLADEAQLATKDFYAQLEKEELPEKKPEGIVIARCANGDQVLLLHDGVVIRFSHEMPEATEQWPSLAQFIVDAIND